MADRLFSGIFYLSSVLELEYNDYGYPISWEVEAIMVSSHSIREIKATDAFFVDISGDSGGLYSIGRYKIDKIVQYNSATGTVTLTVSWDYIYPTEDSYSPPYFVYCAVGSVTEYDQVTLVSKEEYNLSDEFFTACYNFNNISMANALENKTPKKTGSISQPLVYTEGVDNPNKFILDKVPIINVNSFYVVINSISYRLNKYFEYIKGENAVEWTFTSSIGGFDLDENMDIEVAYEYVIE